MGGGGLMRQMGEAAVNWLSAANVYGFCSRQPDSCSPSDMENDIPFPFPGSVHSRKPGDCGGEIQQAYVF